MSQTVVERGAARHPKLGEVLVAAGVVTHLALSDALRAQAIEHPPRRVGQILVERGLLTEEKLAKALAGQLRLGYVHLPSMALDSRVVRLVPYPLAVRLQVIAVKFSDGGALVLAMADPTNVLARDDVAAATGRRVQPVCGAATDISAAQALYYFLETAPANPYALQGQHVSSGFLEIITEPQPPEAPVRGEEEPAREPNGVPDMPAALQVSVPGPGAAADHLDVVDVLVEDAARAGASELVVEPEPEGVAVRVRDAGEWREVLFVPKHFQVPLVERLSAMFHLGRSHRLASEERTVSLPLSRRSVGVRVTTRPGPHGDRIAVEFVLPGSADLAQLGMDEGVVGALRTAIAAPGGLVIVAGPPGSGVPTTVRALMGESRGDAAHRGVRIVDVGAVADVTTAEMALGAASDSTALARVNAPCAPSALAALVEWGLERTVLSSLVRLVLAQRLVRRVCPECMGDGCRECRYSGYAGRTALVQVLEMSDRVREQLAVQPSADALTEAACQSGMLDFVEAGARLVAAGITTAAEVDRVLGRLPECPGCGRRQDPDWLVCPYCGSPGVAARAAPAGDTRHRVMVVDDDESFARLLELALSSEGYDVSVANTGADALRLVVRDPPQAVILDVGLPDMDGIAVCRELRAIAETSLVPILFLSGHDDTHTERRSLEVGGDDYMVKPVTIERLLSRLETRLGRGVVAPR